MQWAWLCSRLIGCETYCILSVIEHVLSFRCYLVINLTLCSCRNCPRTRQRLWRSLWDAILQTVRGRTVGLRLYTSWEWDRGERDNFLECTGMMLMMDTCELCVCVCPRVLVMVQDVCRDGRFAVWAGGRWRVDPRGAARAQIPHFSSLLLPGRHLTRY